MFVDPCSKEPSNLMKIFLDTRRSRCRKVWAISPGILPLMCRTECAFVISDFRRDVEENCALLVYYAARIGNSLPTFRDKLPVPASRVLWFCAHSLHTKLQLSWRFDTPWNGQSAEIFLSPLSLLITLHLKKRVGVFYFSPAFSLWVEFFSPLFRLFCYTALLTRDIFTKLPATHYFHEHTFPQQKAYLFRTNH
jgi:hypothetical protein